MNERVRFNLEELANEGKKHNKGMYVKRPLSSSVDVLGGRGKIDEYVVVCGVFLSGGGMD